MTEKSNGLKWNFRGRLSYAFKKKRMPGFSLCDYKGILDNFFFIIYFRVVFLKLIFVLNCLLMLGRPIHMNKFLGSFSAAVLMAEYCGSLNWFLEYC